MLTWFKFATVAVLVGLTSTASAQDKFISESGTVFLEQCSRTVTDMCVFYTAGVWHGAISMGAFIPGKQFFCFPEKSTMGQMLQVGLKYMREHPEMQHLRASELLVLSWATAFPCTADAK